MPVSIPNIADAEGVVTHWLRVYSGEEPEGCPDSVDSAVLAIVEDEGRRLFGDDENEIALASILSFSDGAAFGIRVALAIVNAPFGGAEEAIGNARALAMRDLGRGAKALREERARQARVAS